MKISLVIPAYNEESVIATCLKHAMRNSDALFSEIIVIDNASTDRTAEIARQVPGVRVVREPNKGLTHARERGFKEATGDVLAYIDADTRMPEGWARRVAEAFEKNPRLACISGPYHYYDIPRWQQALVTVYWYVLAMPVYFFVRYMTVGGNFAIRRSVLQKMNGFDTSIAFYGEDTNIARRAHQFGKVQFSPRLTMPTSGRRIAKEGMWKTAFVYVLNFVGEAFAHRPLTRHYKDIR